MAKASGLSRTARHAGLRESGSLSSGEAAASARPTRVRARSGGRKRSSAKAPTLLRDLDALVETSARGDPQWPLRWICKSSPHLAKELRAKGHTARQHSVCDLLAQLGYSLQAARKIRQGVILPIATRNSRISQPWWRNIRGPTSR